MSSTAAASAAAAPEQPPAMWARIRLADSRDVPHIHRLIRQKAEFGKLTHLFSATESSLSSTLFPYPPLPPFHSFTVLILELSPDPFTPDDEEHKNVANPSLFRSIVQQVELKSPVEDPEKAEFASPRGGGAAVVGYVLCFPNYSTFLAKPGLYVEDIFVRVAWRRMGFGRMLLSAVAAQAAKMGMGRVEWCVLHWNTSAIGFYEEMGAEVLPEWRICRLAGEALRGYGEGGDRSW